MANPLISINFGPAPSQSSQGDGVKMLSGSVFNEQHLERLWTSIEPDYKQKQLWASDPGTPYSKTRTLRSMDTDNDLEFLPGCDIVGCGYNVLTGYYADSRSCLASLFDLESSGLAKVSIGDKEYAKPRVVLMRPRYATSTYVQTGKTIQQYNSSISSKTGLEGGYSFFSASVEVDIGINQATNQQNEFCKVQSNVETFALQLDTGHEKVLKPQVQNDIDAMTDLDELYDTYGTHYLRTIVMGGHATYTSSTNKNEFNSDFELGLVASMSFKFLVGSASASEEAKYKTSVKSFNESSSTDIKTSGGDIGKGGPNFAEHIDEWLDSVKNYMTLSDFVHGETVPLWRLASTKERQNVLQKHYPEYCKRKQVNYSSSGLPPLRVRKVQVTKCFRTFYEVGTPDIGGNWSYLGQTNGYGSTIVVQENEPGSGMLGPIGKWEKLGEYGNDRYSVWRGVPANPVDYVVLGDFTHQGTGPPTGEETKGIRAVHRSCVTSAGFLFPSETLMMYGNFALGYHNFPTLHDLKLYVMVMFPGGIQREMFRLVASHLQVDD